MIGYVMMAITGIILLLILYFIITPSSLEKIIESMIFLLDDLPQYKGD